MKKLIVLITVLVISCTTKKEEEVVTYYNANSTDGYILKIISTQEGIISQEFEEVDWEVKPVKDMTASESDYETLCNLVKQ